MGSIDSYSVDVGLTWHDGDSTISGPSSCTVGGTFLPPTPAPRLGYVFTGWKAIPRQTCGIEEIGRSPIGLDSLNVDTSYNYYYLGAKGLNEEGFRLTNNSEWAAALRDYSVPKAFGLYGMSNCNAVGGGYFEVKALLNTEDKGGNCWCKVIGTATGVWNVNNNDYSRGPDCMVSSSSWVLSQPWMSESDCDLYCAAECADRMENNDYEFLRPLLESVWK